MLQITEESPVRLVLQDRRPRAAAAALLVAGVSALMVVSLSIQGIQRFSGVAVDYPLVRGLGLVIFLLLGAGLALIGGLAALSFAYGTSCIFDRERESFVLRRMNVFRPQEIRHSLYGVARIDVEINDEVRAYGLFVVLRSGERIPLTAISMLDEAHMQHVVAQMRAFLRAG